MFKSITLAAVVIAASASIASAGASNISNFVEQQDSNGLVEMGTVTAEGNGIVEIYSFHKGVQGNLLGSEQSGHAHSVGMDLYLRMLNDMVRALRGEEAGEIHPPPEVYFDGLAQIPTAYVNDERAKLDFYRRLARVAELSEIARLRSELRDRFGPIPVEAERLLASAELRLLGARMGIESIAVNGDVTRVSFRAGAAPRLAKLTTALDEVQFEAEVRRAMPLSLRLTRLGGLQTGPGLVRAFATALGEEIPDAAENGRPLMS